MIDRSFLVFICFLLGVTQTTAQEVVKVDSFRPKVNTATQNQPLTQQHTSVLEPIISPYQYEIKPEILNINPKAIELKPVSNVSPWLMQWSGGGLTGNNSHRETPGMGFGNTSSFIMSQQLGQASLYSNLSVSKDYMSGWGYMNNASLGMQLSYPINSNIGITAFGGINQAGFLTSGSHSMLGYYYGGFVTMNTNNGKFGMDMGMRRYYDPMSGQWINVPIVAPYVRMWGQKMSMDMGGLLLQSIKGLDKWLNPNSSYSGGNRRGGGIIMPETNTQINIPPPNIPYVK